MSGQRSNSLLARIVAAVAGLALAGLMAVIAIGHFQARKLVFAHEAREGMIVARALQIAIEGELDEWLTARAAADVENLIERLGGEGDLQNLFVIRADGTVLARSARTERPVMYEPQIARALRDAKPVAHVDREGELLAFVVPISPPSPQLPMLLLLFERSVSASLTAVWDDTLVRSFGAFVVAALLALAVVTPLRRSVIRPTAALARQADLLGSGDLAARSGLSATSAGSKEMQGLAAAFDTMGDRLQELETQRLAADLSLRASEARYRAMVESSDNLICRTLPDGRLTFVNDACCRHYSQSRDELLGRSFAEFLPESERNALAPLRATLERDGAANYEQSSVAAGGAVRWHLWSHRAVRDSEGGLLEYQAVAHDITARKLAEEKLHAANVDLEERVHQRTSDLEVAVRELESFSYSVAHDLRSPLRSIDGFGQILTEQLASQLDPESARLLARMRRSAREMGLLIDGLLTLAQVARAEIERTRVDLSASATECISALRRAEPNRDIEVVIQPGMEASADADLLRVALAQLIDNAWKFTRGVERPRVEVGVTRKLNQAVAYVRDNGAGFNMAYVERLFTAFRRLHSPEQQSGSGIGLAIVQRIVKRHGGQLWAESAPGAGATFYFTLAGS